MTKVLLEKSKSSPNKHYDTQLSYEDIEQITMFWSYLNIDEDEARMAYFNLQSQPLLVQNYLFLLRDVAKIKNKFDESLKQYDLLSCQLEELMSRNSDPDDFCRKLALQRAHLFKLIEITQMCQNLIGFYVHLPSLTPDPLQFIPQFSKSIQRIYGYIPTYLHRSGMFTLDQASLKAQTWLDQAQQAGFSIQQTCLMFFCGYDFATSSQLSEMFFVYLLNQSKVKFPLLKSAQVYTFLENDSQKIKDEFHKEKLFQLPNAKIPFFGQLVQKQVQKDDEFDLLYKMVKAKPDAKFDDINMDFFEEVYKKRDVKFYQLKEQEINRLQHWLQQQRSEAKQIQVSDNSWIPKIKPKIVQKPVEKPKILNNEDTIPKAVEIGIKISQVTKQIVDKKQLSQSFYAPVKMENTAVLKAKAIGKAIEEKINKK